MQRLTENGRPGRLYLTTSADRSLLFLFVRKCRFLYKDKQTRRSISIGIDKSHSVTVFSCTLKKLAHNWAA